MCAKVVFHSQLEPIMPTNSYWLPVKWYDPINRIALESIIPSKIIDPSIALRVNFALKPSIDAASGFKA